MKKLLFAIALFSLGTLSAQEHNPYISLTTDVNKATGLIDNPRTENDHRGLDWDLEVGLNPDNLGIYIYYGEFAIADYKNYGLGAEYFPLNNQQYELSIGGSVGSILRKDSGNWANFITVNARSVFTLWIYKNIGISARAQYQVRPDINTHGILEGSLGIKLEL